MTAPSTAHVETVPTEATKLVKEFKVDAWEAYTDLDNGQYPSSLKAMSEYSLERLIELVEYDFKRRNPECIAVIIKQSDCGCKLVCLAEMKPGTTEVCFKPKTYIVSVTEVTVWL